MKRILLALALLALRAVMPAVAQAALLDQNGHPVAGLPALAKGRSLLVTFGYTHCGDICPMQVMTMTEALVKLPPAINAKVQPVFVTVDPARDTSAVLQDYLASDPGFVGLTGDPVDLDALAAANGIYHQADSSKPGQIDHTQAILLLDAQGRLIETYTDTDVADLAIDLKKRLE